MDSANKIRTWSIATEGSTYSVSHGVLGGAQQTTLVACEGKNIGRANEHGINHQRATLKSALQKDQLGIHTNVVLLSEEGCIARHILIHNI